MNKQEIINQIIEDSRKKYKAWQQYPVAKWQRERLEELGILDICLNIENFGHSDAKAIIAAADDEGGQVGSWTVDLEGDVTDVPASKLSQSLSEELDERETKAHQNLNRVIETIRGTTDGQLTDRDVRIIMKYTHKNRRITSGRYEYQLKEWQGGKDDFHHHLYINLRRGSRLKNVGYIDLLDYRAVKQHGTFNEIADAIQVCRRTRQEWQDAFEANMLTA